jgi:hypothetical protein
LAANVDSVSAPPSIQSNTIRGSRRRASSLSSATETALLTPRLEDRLWLTPYSTSP